MRSSHAGDGRRPPRLATGSNKSRFGFNTGARLSALSASMALESLRSSAPPWPLLRVILTPHRGHSGPSFAAALRPFWNDATLRRERRCLRPTRDKRPAAKTALSSGWAKRRGPRATVRPGFANQALGAWSSALCLQGTQSQENLTHLHDVFALKPPSANTWADW